MPVPDRLDRPRSCLVLIDVQTRFRDLIHGMPGVIKNSGRLVRFFQTLELPTLVTEHYSEKLGATVPELRQMFTKFSPREKITFSCADNDGFSTALTATGRDQVVLCGIETHVCVYQTARDLLARGLQVAIAADAVSSRTAQNREIGLQRMRDVGAQIMSTEMIMFEILREAGTPDFKAVADILKEL